MPQNLCKVCGEPVTPPRWAYCSPGCYIEANNTSRRNSNWQAQRHCSICGRVFNPTVHNKKYCSITCRKAADRQKAKRRKARRRDLSARAQAERSPKPDKGLGAYTKEKRHWLGRNLSAVEDRQDKIRDLVVQARRGSETAAKRLDTEFGIVYRRL